MKAYQIKIELVNSKPLIWRRIVMPANATFFRLHTIIQDTIGFYEEFSMDNKIYEFDLPEEKIRVTNDDNAYKMHKMYEKDTVYKKHKDKNNVLKDIIDIKIRKPQTLKIEKYIEKHKRLTYVYDFKCYWEHKIILEDIIEDYKNKYPMLIDGEQDGPIEDIGGLDQYYEFKETYDNTSHPEHEKAKALAQKQDYYGYDFAHINHVLKMRKYGK